MSLAYAVTAFISLCMVGVCVAADRKRDAWLILVFVSVSVCNLGYFMLSISKDLGDALNSNRLSYLGSVFLPFFLLMMVLRFCGLKRRRRIVLALAVIGISMSSTRSVPARSTTSRPRIVNGRAWHCQTSQRSFRRTH